ncbi:DUF2780 domain-containing protein [Colwellia sp. MSW7]|uniref:DUF2780 domain-containing protein n=1 Tax=Colwellia maritima TaxID=2912588 RepID=A0ABS9WXS5_9GAMM|nr:DUF2780 domain-containing protein [Colwellia maritima]MCI2282800.1 DUF2780 domain-containing protein [Colwellia maritima]
MKKLILLLTVTTLSSSAMAAETIWLDSLKNLVGLGETQEQSAVEKLSSDGLVNMLTSGLGVNTEQASGGMGSLLNYVKNNVTSDQFSQLASSVPGVEGLVGQMPDLSKLGSSEGLGGLLDKASEYSDSLKSINDVKRQFEALGLKPEMITSFIASAQRYLDTEEGQQAKQVLTEGLAKLLG